MTHEIVNKTQRLVLTRVDKIYQHKHNQINKKMDGVQKTKLGMLGFIFIYAISIKMLHHQSIIIVSS